MDGVVAFVDDAAGDTVDLQQDAFPVIGPGKIDGGIKTDGFYQTVGQFALVIPVFVHGSEPFASA